MTEELEKLRDYLLTKKPALSRLEGVVNDIIIKNRNDRELLVKLCIRTGILQSFIKESSFDPLFISSCKKKLIEEFFFGESAVEKAIAYCKFLVDKDKKVELIPYRKGSKWGFCTPDKKILIDCEFDIAFRFSDGLARVKRNGKWGFIDLNGNIKIALDYDNAQSFREGLAAVIKFGRDWSFIDQNGNSIFSDFDYLNDFYDGLAPVGKSLICYIDSNGNSIIKDSLNELAPDGGYIEIRRIYGFIDRNGSFIIPCIYEYNDYNSKEIYREETEGEIEVTEPGFKFSEGCVRLKKNDKYGFADTNGKIIAPFIFDEADDFSEGLAEVGIISPNNQADIRSGYIDISGAYVIPLKYQYEHQKVWGYRRQSQFCEDMALVTSMSKLGYGIGQKEFFINKNDEAIIESGSYKLCTGFSEGLAVVSKEYGEYIFQKGRDTKYGFIDKNGNLAIEFRFDRAQSFSDGLAAVRMNGKYGFIDNLGEIIIDCKYSNDFRRSKFINGLLFVHGEPWKPGKGYINKKGVEFWED
jgi:hypothetical protein